SHYSHHPHLHSFPTRRSSDLLVTASRQQCLNCSSIGRARTAPGNIGKPQRNKRSSHSTYRKAACTFSGVHSASNALTFRPSALRSEEHTSELQSLAYLVCRLL